MNFTKTPPLLDRSGHGHVRLRSKPLLEAIATEVMARPKLEARGVANLA